MKNLQMITVSARGLAAFVSKQFTLIWFSFVWL